jgi:hypothetical protein
MLDETIYRETFEISREDFMSWLAGKAPDMSVGICKDSSRCPLAVYLAVKGYDVEVGDDSISLYSFGELTHFFLPAWMRAFIARVDEGMANTLVTAVRARACMESANV